MGLTASAAVGPPPGMKVRLSSNESPFGPSPKALEAARAVLGESHRYPDDQSVALRTALAESMGRELDEVAVTNGSAAALMDLIPFACVGTPDAEVLAFEHAFMVYGFAAQNAGARYIEVPAQPPTTLGAAEHRDVDALLARVTEATRVVVVDNPGNPTGSHLDADALRRLVTGLPDHVMVIIDEAYHHFASGQRGYATVAELGLDHPRLISLHTFSKAYALAGMRVGVIAGPSSVVTAVDARRPRFNLTSSSQAAAIASLGDTDHLHTTVAGTLKGRRRMVEGLRELGTSFADGLGNFVLIDLGVPAAPIVEAYADHGVGVRPMTPYDLHEHIRVSVGVPDEVDAFLVASRDVLTRLPQHT